MDTRLKQRLIGAIVLVALAVIFLPMLVKGPAPDSGGAQDVPLRVPSPPAMQDAPQQGVQAGAEGQYETRELPLVVPNAPASGSATGMPVTAPPPSTAQNGNALPSTAAAGNYAVNFGAYATEVFRGAIKAIFGKQFFGGFQDLNLFLV